MTILRSPHLLVVEDDPSLRANLVRWLELAGYDVAGAADAEEAVAAFGARRADLVITDYMLPGLSGLDLMAALRERDRHVAFIFLTGQATLDVAIAALREGRAYDLLRKPLVDLSQLRRAVEGALAGRAATQVTPALAPAMPGAPSMADPAAGDVLSPREVQILRLVGAGLGNKEIARRLARSEKTIRNQLSTIYAKLGVETRTQAALYVQGRDRG